MQVKVKKNGTRLAVRAQMCIRDSYNTWTDTIYSVDKDFQEKPIITVKPGDHRFPRDYVPIDHIFQKKYFGITKLIETRRYFLFKYYYQGYTMAFVDKKTWRTSKFQYEWDESVGCLLYTSRCV